MDFLKSKEVMELLLIKDHNALYRLVRSGHIPAYKVGGQYLYKRNEIIRMVTASKINSFDKFKN